MLKYGSKPDKIQPVDATGTGIKTENIFELLYTQELIRCDRNEENLAKLCKRLTQLRKNYEGKPKLPKLCIKKWREVILLLSPILKT